MRKHSQFLTKILEAFLTAYQLPLIKIPNETSQEKFNISQIIMKCHKCLHRFPFKSGRIPNESKKQYTAKFYCQPKEICLKWRNSLLNFSVQITFPF